MATTINLVAGWTAELPAFTLRANGTPLDLTGFTAAQIVAKIKEARTTGAYVDMSNNVRLDDDPVTGKVYLKPDAADFVAGKTYDLRFQVTDGAGNVEFFPNATPNRIVVAVP